MHDRADIVDTVNRYTIAMNSRRWDMFDEILADDFRIDFGDGVFWDDVEIFKRDFAALHAPFDASQHITSNHVITIDGNQARCLSYVQGCFIRHAAEGGSKFESAGWYDDRLVHAPDGWRIAERRFGIIRWSGNPAVVQMTPGAPYNPTLSALHVEGAAGNVGFFSARNPG